MSKYLHRNYRCSNISDGLSDQTAGRCQPRNQSLIFCVPYSTCSSCTVVSSVLDYFMLAYKDVISYTVVSSVLDNVMWAYKDGQLEDGYPKSLRSLQFPEPPKYTVTLKQRDGSERLLLFGVSIIMCDRSV